MTDALVQAMSSEQLESFKRDNSTNESLVAHIDGILTMRATEAAAIKVLDSFNKDVGKLIAKLPHPETIHNIYIRWAESEVTDTTGEPVTVTITDTQAVLGDDGVIVTPAVTHDEERLPVVKTWQWVVDLNKGFTVGTTRTAAASGSKRAVSVFKREGTALTPVGNFPTASKAAEHLGVLVGADSARRALERDDYIIDAYTGTDYTAS